MFNTRINWGASPFPSSPNIRGGWIPTHNANKWGWWKLFILHKTHGPQRFGLLTNPHSKPGLPCEFFRIKGNYNWFLLLRYRTKETPSNANIAVMLCKYILKVECNSSFPPWVRRRCLNLHGEERLEEITEHPPSILEEDGRDPGEYPLSTAHSSKLQLLPHLCN